MAFTIRPGTYQGLPYSQAVTFGRTPPEKARVVPLSFQFSPTLPNSYAVNVGGLNQFSLIQSMFIDNSNSPAETVVTFSGTGEVVVAAPYSRGFYIVASSDLTLSVVNNSQATAVNTSQFNVVINLYNTIMPPGLNTQLPSVLGSGDLQTPPRIGSASVSFSGDVLTGITSNTPLLVGSFGFVQGKTGVPYYLTHVDAMFSCAAQASSTYLQFALVDWSVAQNLALSVFAQTQVVTSTTGAINQKLWELNDICLFGVGVPALMVPTGNGVGQAAMTVIGGYTSSLPE